MDKNVSVVRVDTRHHRVIARENWGLTDEQMKGMHVHHRIHRSKGGTNDPSNLYVCSPWYHEAIWHNGSGGFIELAREGGKLGSKKGAEAVHKEKDENGKSKHAVKMGKRGAEKTHKAKDENGKSLVAVILNEKIHREKDEKGRSLHALKAGEKTATQIWESTIDGFRSNAPGVVRHNRANGWDSDARVRVG